MCICVQKSPLSLSPFFDPPRNLMRQEIILMWDDLIRSDLKSTKMTNTHSEHVCVSLWFLAYDCNVWRFCLLFAECTAGMRKSGGLTADCWTVDDAMDHTKVSDFILRRETVITRSHHSTGVELFELYNGINWHGFSRTPVAFGMPMDGSFSAIIRLHWICSRNWLRTSHQR